MGQDLLQAKTAAEMALNVILADETARASWMIRGFDAISREEVRAYAAQMQWLPEASAMDPEPGREALATEIDAHPKLLISRQQAEEDVQRFFTLLEHGYCGYGFFRQRGDFDAAQAAVTHELQTRSLWRPSNLASLIRRHLDFVHDCHLRVGAEAFCRHQDFWYDTTHEIGLTDAGYAFVSEGDSYTVEAINGTGGADWFFPSLNQQGDPIYRLGAVSYTHLRAHET